jgi:hypothetical protein
VPLKRSREYASIRKRVADPKPFDTWLASNDSYFVFEMRSDEESPTPSVALFRMRWEDDGPVTAIIITPRAGTDEVDVHDLSRPGTTYSVRLSDDPPAGL